MGTYFLLRWDLEGATSIYGEPIARDVAALGAACVFWMSAICGLGPYREPDEGPKIAAYAVGFVLAAAPIIAGLVVVSVAT